MSKKETAKELYQELLDLRNVSGSRLHHRLTLANRLLADREWVDSEGGEVMALERLEENAFADICGAMHLVDMLELIRRIPAEAEWKKNKYNLRRMFLEMKAQERATKAAARTSEIDSDGEPVGGAGTEAMPMDHRDVLIQQLRNENRQLRVDVTQLKKDNVRLRKVIEKIHALQASV